MTMPFAVPLITSVPIKHIVSKSVIDFMEFNVTSKLSVFFIASDSPVSEDCLTYKLLDSIILKSAGIILPLERITVSPIVTFLMGT